MAEVKLRLTPHNGGYRAEMRLGARIVAWPVVLREPILGLAPWRWMVARLGEK